MKIIDSSICNINVIEKIANDKIIRSGAKGEEGASNRKRKKTFSGEKSLHVTICSSQSREEILHATHEKGNINIAITENVNNKKGQSVPNGQVEFPHITAIPNSLQKTQLKMSSMARAESVDGIGSLTRIACVTRINHVGGNLNDEELKSKVKEFYKGAHENVNVNDMGEKLQEGEEEKKKKKNHSYPFVRDENKKSKENELVDEENYMYNFQKKNTLTENEVCSHKFAHAIKIKEEFCRESSPNGNPDSLCDKIKASEMFYIPKFQPCFCENSNARVVVPIRGNDKSDHNPNQHSDSQNVEDSKNIEKEIKYLINIEKNGLICRSNTGENVEDGKTKNSGEANGRVGENKECASKGNNRKNDIQVGDNYNVGEVEGDKSAERSAAERSAAEPSTAEPSAAEPSAAEPSAAEPSAAEAPPSPTSESESTNDIEQLKAEIKKEIYNRLSIALDINMCLNTDEEYYDKFKKKKKFRKYIVNTSKFVIILGKQLNLSFSTITIALYYLHRYHQKVLKKKKNSLPYLLAGACIFLAWKLREDFENFKKSKKLYDIPKIIFKLLNYFDKKKKIKKKMKEIQIGMLINSKSTNRGEFKISSEDTFGTFMERVKRTEMQKGDRRSRENERGTNDRAINDRAINDRGKNDRDQNDREKKDREKKDREKKDRDKNDRTINDRGKNDRDKNDRGKNDIGTVKKKERNTSPVRDTKKLATEEEKKKKSLYHDLDEIKGIINTGYISDVNNISHVSDYFNSYLSEYNSNDVSEYEECESGVSSIPKQNDDKKDTQSDSSICKNLADNQEQMTKRDIRKFQQLCKNEKQKIKISSSQWILKNSGQKLQLMQKIIIYYEGEILKSINYFLKTENFSFEILPSFIASFGYIMKDYIEQKQISYLQKIAFLSILDYYKTPLCLIFNSKEIMVACILRSYISLKCICSQLHLRTLSLQDFENKAIHFTQFLSCDNPISINRVKIALREIRLFDE
ncbi:hypothetical protein, conserved [Plasmodium gonderi]|uniref:Uncharacterized protein n=1 Tax=Plasmodium gonderi TaxID=77519 RepID=A0A1Y1J9R3_PLAGO|nr:hypothetical protein, conserved [Plasmodium gonderi]GAW79010.1 hypothetical protein, conserved [Plasmodium gonderi]